ncbi:MAG: prepilin-type N-terminal cleavage/methylation domain-containing protein [Acidobacteriia bacterium]|nr:prepilin-type N-terminal cleavage/methylation domain-containing protein [Terriglobia bacterium]
MLNGSLWSGLAGCHACIPAGISSAVTAAGTKARPRLRTPRSRLRGFTFVELMVVISIIVILITISIPIYSNTIRSSKESVLKNNLFTLRTVIDNYTYDKGKAPQSLQDLVPGYLREIPYDPMTKSNQSWRIIMEEASQSVSQSEPGIFDVKSGSDKIGLDGTPYAEW